MSSTSNNSNNNNNNDLKSNSNTEIGENTCVVCFKTCKIYSIGECDHPVCYECSTRMRVLCNTNDCMICRRGLSKVIFTYEKLPFRELEAKNRSEFYIKKYQISCSTNEIQKEFNKLLNHSCPICECPSFRTFVSLSDHVRKQHGLYYCDLCTDNLKIFSFERKCYTRAELGTHRRIGDPDNKSHRGHPLCEYCDCRYLDRDELFRHLRREHYFCHFCDADGSNQFYGDYESLQQHFRSEHFLCEEGKCIEERFTCVFRTEIDLKAHISNVHGKSMGKLQAKQARTLQLEITLGPRGRSGHNEQNFANVHSRCEEGDNNEYEPFQPQIQQPTVIDARNEQEFPSLGSGSSANVTLMHPAISIRSKFGQAGLARTKENFPALGGGRSDIGGPSLNPKPSQPPVSAVLRKNPKPVMPLNNPNGGSLTIHVSNRPNSKNITNHKEFPALPGNNKHTNSLNDDMVPSTSGLNMKTVQAKHRSLVDDYVSVANPATFQKLQFVQNETHNKPTKKLLDDQDAPKLTNLDFPSLSKPVAKTQCKWVKTQKEREAENRKSKVAPHPLFNHSETKTKQKITKSISSPDIDTNNKKDKKTSKLLSNGNEKKQNNQKQAATSSTNSKHQNSKKDETNNQTKKPTNKVSMQSKDSEHELNAQIEGLAVGGPPPGFNDTKNKPKPPPGFQTVTLNSLAKSPHNLTFTSSMGEQFAIVPSHPYLPPQNSVERNQELVQHFRTTLPLPESMAEFMSISKKFKDGDYKPDNYYDQCQEALKNKFDEVFPELLALLPNINKQQELYLVHSQNLKKLPNNKKNQALRMKLTVCPACKQVLIASDNEYHTKLHSLNLNFPFLPENGMVSSAN